jgi:hypothetical protein
LSTTGITSSLLSQIAGTPSTANQFVTDLNQLSQDLQGGNVSAAQDDYVTLSEDAQNGAGSSTATTSASGITTSLLKDIASSSSSSTSFLDNLNQLGTDLQSGDLISAQQDMLDLDSTALNAASAASAGVSGIAGSAAPANQAESAQLIQSIVQAMEVGDNSMVSSGMSLLASISPSSQGASLLAQDSAGYGSNSGTSSSNSIGQLLESAGTSDSGNSTSGLSLLA